MTYYTIYKITNKINGKIYIGSHKTENLKDKYMGSGKYLNHSINKHGVENFDKEILFVFDTPEEMYAKEAELVTLDFIAEENTYNLKVGGFGGWDYVNGKGHNGSLAGVDARRELMKNSPEWVNSWKQSIIDASSDIDHVARVATIKERYGNDAFKTFAGKRHTDETKQKMSDSSKGNGIGNKNSQYGTCWVHSLALKQSKKIKTEDLQSYITDGWIQGRKMKF